MPNTYHDGRVGSELSGQRARASYDETPAHFSRSAGTRRSVDCAPMLVSRRLLFRLLAFAVAIGSFGCASLDMNDVHGDPADENFHIGRGTSALTLAELSGMHGCSTQGVQGLSQQLLSGMFCLAPNTLVRFSHPNIILTSDRVNPYLAPEGVAAILRVAERRELRINSALRTLAEQYILSQTCSVAASPGRSNHETGRAIDVANWSEALDDLTAEGFVHPLPGTDDVHFEYGGTDLRSISVRAFQRLWNANHPDDLIAEDGDIGAETSARLALSPAEGFSVEAPCVCVVGCADAGASDGGVLIDAAAPLDPLPPDNCACVAAGAAPARRGVLLFVLVLVACFGARRTRRPPRMMRALTR